MAEITKSNIHKLSLAVVDSKNSTLMVDKHHSSLNDFVFFVFAFLMYWSQGPAVQQVLAMFGYYNDKMDVVVEVLTYSFFVIWIIIEPKMRISLVRLLVPMLLFIGFYFSVKFNPNSLGFFSGYNGLLNRFQPFVLAGILLSLKFNRADHYINLFMKLFVSFASFEALLGLLQFIFHSIIFPSTVKGVNLVGSVYYILGSSKAGTGDLALAQSGQYLVRANGLSGSGLYLGITLLCALAFSRIVKNRAARLILQTLFLVTGVLTFTVTIWFGLVVFVALALFEKKVGRIPKTLIGFAGVITIIWPVYGWTVAKFLSGFATLNSRMRGLTYYISTMKTGVRELIFGQNFISNWVIDSTVNGNTLTVDNTLFAWLLNIGFLGIILCITMCILTVIPLRKKTIHAKYDLIFPLVITFVLLSNVNDFTRMLTGLLIVLSLNYVSKSSKNRSDLYD